MKIDGQCHCGQIRFEAEVDPTALNICHCSDCQKLTGSAFRANVQAAADHFKLLSGTLTSYIKTADSGAKRRHTFCPVCGTPIYACDPVDPQRYSLRIGTINQRAQFAAPRRQIWRRSALPWVDRLGDVPAMDKQ